MNQSLLSFLLKDKPEDFWLYVWSKEGKSSTSKWFTDVETAITYAEGIGKEHDTYFGIGLTKKKPKIKSRKDSKSGETRKVLPSQQRLESSEVDGLSCVWVDIDYKDSVHKKSNLPPTEEDALSLITSMPLKASAIIHSGHGYQAYWLFDTFFEIETKEDREKVSNIIQGWQRKIQNLALSKGWEVDSTFDLSRVYRVNNTMNFKDEPKPVILLSQDEKAVYSLDEFEPYLETEVKKIKHTEDSKEQVKIEGAITLDANADVPKIKFDALIDNNQKFKQSWNHKRKDMRDTSTSAYDLSIATIAAIAGWKDQEIVNLVIAHRKHHGADLKLREDYYTNTLLKAKEFSSKGKTVDEAIKAEVSDNPEDNLKNVSNAFGIPIIRVEKYLSEPVQFVIHFEGGRQIELKGSSELMSQSVIRTKIADVLDFRIENFRANEWNAIVDKLLASTIKIEVGSDSTQLGLVSHYLYSYFDKYVSLSDDQNERALRQMPVVIGQELCFNLDGFMKFIQSEFSDNLKRNELMQKLTRLGCKGKSKTIRDVANEKTTSRYFWTIEGEFIKKHRKILGIKEDVEEKETL